MKLKMLFVSVLLILIAASASAQLGAKPGPELKKLDFLVGSWTMEGTIAQGPWGMGGKFTSTTTNEWMPGNFFVVGHEDFKMPPELGGDGKANSYMGYDTDKNVYTYDAFNSIGRREVSEGIVKDDTWTWNSTQTYAGQEIKQRLTLKVLSTTSYTMKFELSIDGTNWMTFMDGKATKK